MIVRELVARFGFQVDSSGLDKADKKIKGTKSDLQGLGNAVSGAFAGLAAYGVSSKINEAVDASNRFGESMGKIQSLMPNNIARAKDYKAAIFDLSKAYGTSADDLAATTYDLISTYGDAADNVEKLAIITKTAVAANTSAKETMGLMVSLTKAYGDESATAMQKISDLAAQAINFGVIEMPALTAGMRSAAGMSAQLGVSMEELFGVFASASAITGLGPEVGTQMESIFRAMLDKTKPMAAAFKKAGFKGAADAIQKSGGLGPALVALAKTTDGTEEGLSALFGRIEGMKLSMFLTGKGADDFAGKMKNMRGAAGATNEMFAASTKGLAANAVQARKTAEEVAALKIQVGDELAPKVAELNLYLLEQGKALTEGLLPALGEWNSDLDATGEKVAKISPIVGVLTKTVMGLSIALEEAGAIAGTFVEGLADLSDIAGMGISGVFGDAAGQREAAANIYRRTKESEKEMQERQRRLQKYAITAWDPELAQQEVQLRAAREDVNDFRQKRGKAREDFSHMISGGSGVDWNQTIGAINLSLEVPKDASIPQLEKAVTAGMRKAMVQAANAIPNRTAKSGTGTGVGAAGTNSTFGGP